MSSVAKRLVSSLLVLLLGLNAAYNNLAAQASTLEFKKTSTTALDLQGASEVNKVGALILPKDAKAFFFGDNVKIQSPKEIAKQPLLQGIVLDASSNGRGHKRRLTGAIWMQSGTELKRLAGADGRDEIQTNDGKAYSGQIQVLDHAQVRMLSGGEIRTFGMAEIKSIRSSRLLRFNLTVHVASSEVDNMALSGDAGAISLPQGSDYRLINRTENTSEKHRKRRLVLWFLGGALVATSITLPIVIPLATRSRHHAPSPQDIATGNAFTILTQPKVISPAMAGPGSSSGPSGGHTTGGGTGP